MKLITPFKRLFKPRIKLDPVYLNDVPQALPYSKVKSALSAESLSEVIACFEHFKRFDTQIASELNKRKVQLIGKPIIIESEDQIQDKFLKSFIASRYFRTFLHECSAGIAYGFSSFILNFEQNENGIYPAPQFISYRYFESDQAQRAYISQGGNRIYIDESKDIWTHYHPTDSGNLIEQSLMYKIICIASLKHISLMKYMSYLDSFAVPPIIIKSQSTNSKENAQEILKSALALRSNSVGLFDSSDVIEVINGNVDKGTFLEFLRYCDECISKVITGQVLAGNAVQNGTQALGNVHNDVQKSVCEFDALLLAESIEGFLRSMLKLNFAFVAPFKFEIDTNTEKDEKLQADTYLVLSQMGVQIPIQHLEKSFKIAGLKYANTSNLPNIPTLSLNATQHKLYLDKLDTALQSITPSTDFSLEVFLKDCQTYEQAHKKILESFSGEDLLLKEQELMDYMLNATCYGIDNA